MLSRTVHRRVRVWALALAVTLNLGGGPMAWAHLATAEHPQESTTPMAGCHEQAPVDQPKPAHPMPCCDGGTCDCATPPAPLVVALEAPADLRPETVRAPQVTRLVAPDPLDDTLRPPIH